jgi:hypothetical protein
MLDSSNSRHLGNSPCHFIRENLRCPVDNKIIYLWFYLRMQPAVPSLPHTSSWHSAELIKHRDNFTFCQQLTSCSMVEWLMNYEWERMILEAVMANFLGLIRSKYDCILTQRLTYDVQFTRVAGRAIAQAVSLWFPTAAARVQTRVKSFGICGGQSGAGVGFLQVLRFPLPIFIPPNSPSS